MDLGSEGCEESTVLAYAGDIGTTTGRTNSSDGWGKLFYILVSSESTRKPSSCLNDLGRLTAQVGRSLIETVCAVTE